MQGKTQEGNGMDSLLFEIGMLIDYVKEGNLTKSVKHHVNI